MMATTAEHFLTLRLTIYICNNKTFFSETANLIERKFYMNNHVYILYAASTIEDCNITNDDWLLKSFLNLFL